MSPNTTPPGLPAFSRSPGLDALEPGAEGAISYGVYQIGLVYARSWTVIGMLSGIFTLKNLASWAVQRGLGISITRT